MNESQSLSTTISIDVKKYRIRVFKSALHQIGTPEFIQLLVNPEDMMVAIRAVDKEHTNDQTHKVGKKMHNRNVEFYSHAFIERLCSICGDLERGSTYRLTGRVYPEQRALLFPLKTIRKVSEEGMVE